MKKIAIVVAILALTAPVMADVVITTSTNSSECTVTIGYESDADLSAFALDCNVSDGDTIDDIDNFHTGESITGSKGFGIFPGSIDINSVTAQVDDFGDPVADPCKHPGALGGLNTSGVTIEMGALYVDGNQPPLTGTLCTLTVSDTTKMTIVLNSTRGGVVKADSNDATVSNVPLQVAVGCQNVCTVPNVVDSTQADANAAIEAAGLTVGDITTDCNVNVADGDVASTSPAGGAEVSCGSSVDMVVSQCCDVPYILGLSLYDANQAILNAGLLVGVHDYNTSTIVDRGLVMAQYPPDGTRLPCNPGEVNATTSSGCLPHAHNDFAYWTSAAVNEPSCFCNQRQCYGDAAGDKSGTSKDGYWYVGGTDLTILLACWDDQNTPSTADDFWVKEPPDGPGIATITSPSLGICADFAHDKSGTSKDGYWYVGGTDLTIMLAAWDDQNTPDTGDDFWLKEPPDGPGIPPDWCGDLPGG